MVEPQTKGRVARLWDALTLTALQLLQPPATPREQRTAVKEQGMLVRRRAWETIKTSAFGSLELVVGVVFHMAATLLLERFSDAIGHEPDKRERFMVLVLQWAAAVGFVLHGLMTIALGVALAYRSALEDWKKNHDGE